MPPGLWCILRRNEGSSAVALTIGQRMARVRTRGTEPELRVRKLLSARGVRYRLHRRDLPGKPDLYIALLRLALFVNGCFWHGHEGCRRAALPKTNRTFWTLKIRRNARRDRQAYAELRQLGITPVVFWTCEAASFEKVCNRIALKWTRSH